MFISVSIRLIVQYPASAERQISIVNAHQTNAVQLWPSNIHNVSQEQAALVVFAAMRLSAIIHILIRFVARLPGRPSSPALRWTTSSWWRPALVVILQFVSCARMLRHYILPIPVIPIN
jgi:hypothetical protein